MKAAHKFVAVFVGEERIMEIDFGYPGNAAADNILNAGLRGGRHGDGIAVAPRAGGNPEHIDFGDRLSRHQTNLRRSPAIRIRSIRSLRRILHNHSGDREPDAKTIRHEEAILKDHLTRSPLIIALCSQH
jgi:hypothetical protein